MGCGQNSGRCFLLTICILQIVTTALRQVFDFIGFMWLPIIANFFNFIFVIFGFFGAYQYKPKYIVIYVVWVVAWLGWNVFVTCFYLNVGALDNRQDWLNFGTGSASWWEVNGPGCRPVYPSNLTSVDPFRPLRPERVDGCVMDYQYVETIQAGLQCLLGVAGVTVGVYLLTVWMEEEDTYKTKMKGTSIYSVEYSPNTEDSGDSIDFENGILTSHYNTASTAYQPATSTFQQQPATSTMTPRRVKRHHNRNRNSSRSTARQPSHPTPEMNFANNYSASNLNNLGTTSNGGSVGSMSGIGSAAGGGVPSISGNISQRSHGRSSQRRRTDRQSGRNRRSQYVNPVTQLMDDSSTSTDSQKIVGLSGAGAAGAGVGVAGRLGHSNPMYVHSRPGSMHSITEPVERPPSVHSSYSNYHGVRASVAQNKLSNPPTNNITAALPNMPHGGLNFGRAVPNQAGKGLRGSQNSILGSSEQRRTALTTSEIRVPNTSGNIMTSLHGSMDSNLQIQSQTVHANQLTTVANQLSPRSVTSVTSVSPASIVSHNTTQSSNTPYHLLPPQQQKLQLQQQQQHKQLLLQQAKQQQQQQLHHINKPTHQYPHTNNLQQHFFSNPVTQSQSHVDQHNPNINSSNVSSNQYNNNSNNPPRQAANLPVSSNPQYTTHCYPPGEPSPPYSSPHYSSIPDDREERLPPYVSPNNT